MKFEILPTNCFGFVLSFENKLKRMSSVQIHVLHVLRHALLKKKRMPCFRVVQCQSDQ